MTCTMMFHRVHIVLLAALSVLLTSCVERPMSDAVIVHNEDFVVGTDSVKQGGLLAWCEANGKVRSNADVALLDSLYGHDTTLHWTTHAAPHQQGTVRAADYKLPRYVSFQPLVDGCMRLSMHTIAMALAQDVALRHTMSSGNEHAAMSLSLALLAPERCMASLRSEVRDSVIVIDNEEWPLFNNHYGWAVAAWEVYCVTGDRNWLQWAYDVLQRTVARDEELLVNQNLTLMRGRHQRLLPIYPQEMSLADQMGTMSLATNVALAVTHDMLDKMTDALGLANDNQHVLSSNHLKDLINQQLWDETQGRYDALLYFFDTPRGLPCCDNFAQSVAVLWGIADDNRAEKLIASTPIYHEGVNVLHPLQSSTEPYFDQPCWPTTQALWTLAAAEVNNENMVRRSLGALLRAQALFQPQHLTLAAHATDEVALSAASAAMVLRMIAGIKTDAAGIEFRPFVPACLPGDKHIVGLRYRQATLNITISGTGSDVVSVTANGKTLEGGFLPCDVSGKQNIVVTLRPSPSKGNHVTLASKQAAAVSPQAIVVPDSMWHTTLLVPQPDATWRAYVVTEKAGRHALRIYRSEGASQCQAWLIRTNGHDQGHVLMPPAQDTVASTTIVVNLLAGDNRVGLTETTPLTIPSVPARTPSMWLRYRRLPQP
ncbi:MAG: hypothetical protein II428_02515 [Muribaculaceae bacterium]|nr:hypothetical protein [Muribaculaceae bacterium]